jgi:hypothetical protein
MCEIDKIPIKIPTVRRNMNRRRQERLDETFAGHDDAVPYSLVQPPRRAGNRSGLRIHSTSRNEFRRALGRC